MTDIYANGNYYEELLLSTTLLFAYFLLPCSSAVHISNKADRIPILTLVSRHPVPLEVMHNLKPGVRVGITIARRTHGAQSWLGR